MKKLSLVLVALLALGSAVVAQEGQEQMTDDQMKMMENWMKYKTPGEPHERLQSKAGKWDFAMKMW